LVSILTSMKAPADITYTEKMLHEAMEMLEGLKHHMGMFQTQYYGKLKNRVKQHEALNKNLKVGLNEIGTVEDGREESQCCA
jgi:hypothetical protein